MFVEPFPSYEQIKEDYQNIKTDKDGNYEEKHYDLFMLTVGGYFRLKINEDGNKTIALDYLEGGYLHGILTRLNQEYRFNKLYPLNKTSYDGLYKLYKEMVFRLKDEIDTVIDTLGDKNDTRGNTKQRD